ncbi:uncharacterized protein LOC141528314 [Cotesia typhae]|uniref:uncharacterized protein LOC141528314 n=1 Tax=Cotesia typhae TaxID=2053667 RepID=UPI003D69E7A4
MFKGKDLSDEQEVSGTSLIYELAETMGLDFEVISKKLTDYHLDNGFWSEKYVKSSVSTTSTLKWWKVVCRKMSLSKVAEKILSLPATSAATERSFSTQGWIHSKKRNKLTNERVKKITYISYNMKLFANQKNSRLHDQSELLDSSTDTDSSEDSFVSTS